MRGGRWAVRSCEALRDRLPGRGGVRNTSFPASNLVFCPSSNFTPGEGSSSQLTHWESHAPALLLWGKSPETQSLSSSISWKATSVNYDGGTDEDGWKNFVLVGFAVAHPLAYRLHFRPLCRLVLKAAILPRRERAKI
jgi:hypothetical protein